MKLSISLLSLLAVSILTLSSCSKARYGSLTRSTKVKHIVHSPVKDIRIKYQEDNSKTQKVAVNNMNSVEINVQDFSEKVLTNNLLQTDVNKLMFLAQNADDIEIVPTTRKAALPKALRSHKPAKQLDKMNAQFAQKIDAQQMSKSSDVENILYIIVVVLLVLLILALLSKLGGLLISLVGLALLVLLIYLVLQMI